MIYHLSSESELIYLCFSLMPTHVYEICAEIYKINNV
jgi:hypothetical protein